MTGPPTDLHLRARTNFSMLLSKQETREHSLQQRDVGPALCKALLSS